MIEAILAVPGDLATPTGGYHYARRLLEAAPAAGLALGHLELPGPVATSEPSALAEAGRRLAQVPADMPLIVDGLALGVLPVDMLRSLRARLVALCHHPLGLEPGLDPAATRRLLASERAALAATTRVIATSQTTGQRLVHDFGVTAARLTVARPGTDRPQPMSRRPGEAAPVGILSVGGLTFRKGHDTLIDALARLADLDWTLTIVGPERDPDHAEHIRGLIRRLGPKDRISLAGVLDPEGLAAAFAAADLFVLASRYEGYGMAYTEAMAWGLPVVGCDTGAVAEATLGAAKLVPPGDAGALAAALRPLLAAPAARAALAARCGRAAERLPTWTDTARAVAAAVQTVSAEGARA